MSINPILHSITKYVKIDYHFVTKNGVVSLLTTRYVPSQKQEQIYLQSHLTNPLNQEISPSVLLINQEIKSLKSKRFELQIVFLNFSLVVYLV